MRIFIVSSSSVKSILSSYSSQISGLDGALVHNLYIQHESSFNTQALGDGGTSYGICQWHNGRWTTDYEIPAKKESVAVTRGNTAQGDYWNTYGN